MDGQQHNTPVLQSGILVAGRYRILRQLGSGGMGQVFEVEHEAIGRHFALKLLTFSPCTPELVKRFRREAKALGRVTSPRVAQISDFGYEEGLGPYYVMELLEGETLEDRLERQGRLSLDEALELGEQLALALEDVHRAGLIHRDLKPSNVGLCEGPVRVKLLDFGLAAATDGMLLERITKSQEVVGSLPYMAPERFSKGPLGPAVDLYALGIVLFEMLSGKLPFEGSSAAAMMHDHLSSDPPSFDSRVPGLAVPPQVDAMVRRLLEKPPDRRYATAADAARALSESRFASGSPPTGAAPAAVSDATAAATLVDPYTPTIAQTAGLGDGLAVDPSAATLDNGQTWLADPLPPAYLTTGDMGALEVTRRSSAEQASLDSVPATVSISRTEISAPHEASGAPRSPRGSWTTGQPIPPTSFAPAEPAAPQQRSRLPLIVAVVVATVVALGLGALLAGVLLAQGMGRQRGAPPAATVPIQPAAAAPGPAVRDLQGGSGAGVHEGVAGDGALAPALATGLESRPGDAGQGSGGADAGRRDTARGTPPPSKAGPRPRGHRHGSQSRQVAPLASPRIGPKQGPRPTWDGGIIPY